MSSLISAYSAEPAFPTLASSFLPESSPRDAAEDVGKEAHAPGEWSLKRDIEKGIQSSGEGVFKCGTVIGFSGLRMRSGDEDHERVVELPRYLLSTHLRRSTSGHLLEPRAFIIHRTSSSAFSSDALLASLLANRNVPPLTRDEAIELLDSVQVLAVFDFPSVIQAVSDVSDALHKIQQERRQACKRTEPKTRMVSSDHPVLLIIEGIDTLAEGLIRTSNPLRGTALLMPLLRTLTHLSRTHASFLSVMLVNTSVLGPAYSNPSLPSLSRSAEGQPSHLRDGYRDRNEGIHSIFLHHATSTSLFPNLLSKSLDQGIDTHLLLSKINGREIIEVVKDRTRNNVGRWCTCDWNKWQFRPLDD